MKKLSKLQIIFGAFCSVFLFLSNSFNPPEGRTGAPLPGGGNEQLCSGCHGGNVSGFDGTIGLTGLPASIQPNTTYPVDVTITRTQGSPVRAGFSLTILDDSNNGVGTLSNAGSNVNFSSGTGREYAEHQNAKMFGGNDAVTYSFDWTSPASVSGSNVTFYAVTVLANGSGTSQDYSFTNYPTFTFGSGNPPLTVASISTTDPLCNNTNSGSATVNAAGGTGSYTYAWSSGGSGMTEAGLSAGSYSVTVSSGGESITENFSLQDPPALSVTINEQTNIDCNTQSGQAGAFATGGTGMLSLLWDNGESGNVASNLSAGMHTVTVTDANGCTSTDNVFISSDTTPPTVEAGPSMQLNCNTTAVQLDGTGSDQGGNFTYQWSTANGSILTGDTGLTPTVDAAGTYTLLITNNSNGCSDTDFVFVTSDTSTPIADAGDDMILDCANTQVILDGTGSSQGAIFSYEWQNSNGNTIAGTINTSVSTVGVYTLIVTNNNNGCTSSSTVTVTENSALPTADAGNAQVLDCVTSQVTLNGTNSDSGANITYEWTDAGGNSLGTNATQQVSTAGNYTLTVTNTSTGCSSVDMVTVTEDTQAPNISVGPPALLDCAGGTVTIVTNPSSTSNDFTINWSTTNGNIVQVIADVNAEVDAAGQYCIEVIDNANGCSVTECVQVFQAEDPVLGVISETMPACNGDMNGSITVQAENGSGSYSYSWSTNDTGATLSGIGAGAYTVTVTDGNSCTDVIGINLGQPDALTLSLTSTGETGSGGNNGTATATPGGGTAGYSYLWSNNATTQTVNNLAPGNYSVTVTDANGCTTEGEVSISSFDCALSATFQNTDVACNGEMTGSASLIVENATDPVTYQWSSGGTEATETGLAAGSYTVTVNDASNCELILTTSIDEPSALIAGAENIVTVSCNGGNDGAFEVTASGGSDPYTIAFPNGGDGTGLSAGTYVVTVTDNNSCTAETEVSIQEPSLIEINITTTEISTEGGSDGSASAMVAGGTAPYTFLWSTGATSSSINNLSAGEYCVTITDANNCEMTSCSNVLVSGCASLAVSITSQDVSCNGFDDGTATAMPSGGTGDYSYAWSSGGTEATETGLSAGTYTVELSDSDGCLTSAEVTIGEPAAVTVQAIEIVNIECAGQTSGSATVEAQGGTGDFTYAWSNDGTGPTQMDLAAGTYTVTASDANDCSTVFSLEIEEGADTTPPVVTAEDVTVEIGADGTFSLNAGIPGTATDNCGVGAIVVSQSEFTCADLGENELTLIATDINGNEGTAAFSLFIVDTTPPTVECPTTFTADCDGTVNYEVVSATDACTPLTFDYDPATAPGSVFPNGNTEVEFAVIDPSGNAINCVFTVSLDLLSAEAEVSNTSCADTEDGSIVVTPSGGTVPYTLFYPGDNGTGLAAGEYSVTVEDANGCAVEIPAVVSSPEPITVSVEEVLNEQNNNSNGAIVINVEGGTGGYSFDWLGPDDFTSAEEDLENLSAGEYTLTVIDENGCTTTSTITVEMTTSTQEPAWARTLRLFPNPTDEVLSIEMPLLNDVDFTVYNLTGQQMPTVLRSFSGTNARLDVSTLPSGLYWVKIETDSDAVVRKIVVE